MAPPPPRSERVCHFPNLTEGVMTRVYDASAMAEGTTVDGPALIESPRTSYLVEPGWRLTMGTSGAAWLEHVAAAETRTPHATQAVAA